MPLREFLYLDDRLVQQFLDQILGGRPGPKTIQATSGISRGMQGNARAGVIGGAIDRSHTESFDEQTTIEATPYSRFDQLMSLLADELNVMGPMDTDAWDGFQRGEALSVEGGLAIPELLRNALLSRELTPFIGLVDGLAHLAPLFGKSIDISSDQLAAAKASMPILSDLAEAVQQRGVPVVVTPTDGSNQRFLVQVRPDALIAEVLELECEATVVGRIAQKISRGKPLRLNELLPELDRVTGTSRAQRRKSGHRPVELRYPGAVLTAIAIYR